MLCVSHVLPHPPHAGNEYRINRMLAWMMAKGFDVTVLVCPLAHSTLSSGDVAAAASVYPELLILERSGVLWHNLAADSPVLHRRLACRLVNDAAPPNVDHPPDSSSDFDQSFCPDCLIDTVGHLDAAQPFDIILTVYAFMARTYSQVNSSALKLVDTQDVLSSRTDKVVHFGISDMHLMSEEHEAHLLRQSDVIIGIQPDESEQLARLVPDRIVITVGVDVPVPLNPIPAAVDPIVVLVASFNPMNNKGLLDFLRFAWPLIRRDVPDARLHVIGDVGRAVTWLPNGVDLIGRVADLGVIYERAAVVINPAVAGTGLKIKTIEALAYLRPVVAFPAGIEGMSPAVRALADIANDWYDFAVKVIERLTRPPGSPDDQLLADLRLAFSAEETYAPLAEILRGR